VTVHAIVALRQRAADVLYERGNLLGLAGRIANRLDRYCDAPGCNRRARNQGAWGKQWCDEHFGEDLASVENLGELPR
jgi:hypothetical protein